MTDPDPDLQDLSRREQQIMDIAFAMGETTVADLQERLPDPPSRSAIRKLLGILEEKGRLAHRQEGRSFIFRPRIDRDEAGRAALHKLLATYFDGSVSGALSAHLAAPDETLTPDEVARLSALINKARTVSDARSDSDSAGESAS